jgi:hypothetical protein
MVYISNCETYLKYSTFTIILLFKQIMNLKISLNTNQNEGDSKDLVQYSLKPVTTSGKRQTVTKMIQYI